MAHDYRGNNNISIPITAVIPIMLSPFPRENGKMSIGNNGNSAGMGTTFYRFPVGLGSARSVLPQYWG